MMASCVLLYRVQVHQVQLGSDKVEEDLKKEKEARAAASRALEEETAKTQVGLHFTDCEQVACCLERPGRCLSGPERVVFVCRAGACRGAGSGPGGDPLTQGCHGEAEGRVCCLSSEPATHLSSPVGFMWHSGAGGGGHAQDDDGGGPRGDRRADRRPGPCTGGGQEPQEGQEGIGGGWQAGGYTRTPSVGRLVALMAWAPAYVCTLLACRRRCLGCLLRRRPSPRWMGSRRVMRADRRRRHRRRSRPRWRWQWHSRSSGVAV